MTGKKGCENLHMLENVLLWNQKTFRKAAMSSCQPGIRWILKNSPSLGIREEPHWVSSLVSQIINSCNCYNKKYYYSSLPYSIYYCERIPVWQVDSKIWTRKASYWSTPFLCVIFCLGKHHWIQSRQSCIFEGFSQNLWKSAAVFLLAYMSFKIINEHFLSNTPRQILVQVVNTNVGAATLHPFLLLFLLPSFIPLTCYLSCLWLYC